MANENNNTKELVADDDDPTAELEVLADTFDYLKQQDEEPDASVDELREDLRDRSEQIERLQFDIEQLRARWTGLETEIQAREDLTSKLNKELADARDALARKEKLLRKRDQSIKSLKAEIRDRNDRHSELVDTLSRREQELDDLRELRSAESGETPADQLRRLEQQAGKLASAAAEIRELKQQLQRTEAYADTLRQQVQDNRAARDEVEDTREFLQASLERYTTEAESLRKELDESIASNEQLKSELEGINDKHAEEIRMIRFELGEAQETVAQHELVAEQLASDLVDTRGYRDELEKMLSRSEEQNQERVEALEKDNKRLKDELERASEQLETKSEAVNCLLTELTRKSQQLESIGEIENVIHEIDERMSERSDDASHRDRDRVSRVLIGSVDGQELRFPLFKDRLTIGRAEQNDIQLQASFVSRRHAVVVTDAEAARMIDWGSKNGVFVNSRRVTEHFLKNGDTVTIGTAEFRYEERPKRDA